MLTKHVFPASTAPEEVKDAYLLGHGCLDCSGEPALAVVLPDGQPACYARMGEHGVWCELGWRLWLKRAGTQIWFDKDYLLETARSQKDWRDKSYPARLSMPCSISCQTTSSEGERESVAITGPGAARIELVIAKSAEPAKWMEIPCYDNIGGASLKPGWRKAPSSALRRETAAARNVAVRIWLDGETPFARPYVSSLFWLESSRSRHLCAPLDDLLFTQVHKLKTGRKFFGFPGKPGCQWMVDMREEDKDRLLAEALVEMECGVRDKRARAVAFTDDCNVAFLNETMSWALKSKWNGHNGGELAVTSFRPLRDNPSVFGDSKLIMMDMPEDVCSRIKAILVANQI